METATKSKGHPLLLMLILGGVICLAMAMYDRFFSRPAAAAPPAPAAHSGVDTSTLDLLRDTQVLVDETTAVSAGGLHSYTFSLPSSRPVRVVVEGVRETAKGFDVRMVRPEELEKVQAGLDFRHIPDLSGLKVQSMDKTARLSPGQWALVVSNTQNIMNTMQVRVRVIADP